MSAGARAFTPPASTSETASPMWWRRSMAVRCFTLVRTSRRPTCAARCSRSCDLDRDLGAGPAVGGMEVDRAGGDHQQYIPLRPQRHIAALRVDRREDFQTAVRLWRRVLEEVDRIWNERKRHALCAGRGEQIVPEFGWPGRPARS